MCELMLSLTRIFETKVSLRKLALEGEYKKIRTLISKKNNQNYDLEDQDKQSGRTALMAAAWKGYLDIVEELISHGASLQTQDKFGRTPLIIAIENGNIEIAQLLIDKMSDLEAQTLSSGTTALLYATEVGQLSLVQHLIDKCANINAQDNAGRSPLMWAVRNNHAEIAELLLTNGADTDLKSRWGQSALTIADDNHSERLIDLLREPVEEPIYF